MSGRGVVYPTAFGRIAGPGHLTKQQTYMGSHKIMVYMNKR